MAPCRRLDTLPRNRMAGGGIVHEAISLRSRLLGLAFLRALPPGHALLIPHCRSVHTFGMRFPIDIVFLDENGRVLRVARDTPPRRVLSCRDAFAVLETRAGEAALFSPPSPRAARGGESAR
jgi:uncharacterized membrane protein (UPF0127 family)